MESMEISLTRHGDHWNAKSEGSSGTGMSVRDALACLFECRKLNARNMIGQGTATEGDKFIASHREDLILPEA